MITFKIELLSCIDFAASVLQNVDADLRGLHPPIAVYFVLLARRSPDMINDL